MIKDLYKIFGLSNHSYFILFKKFGLYKTNSKLIFNDTIKQTINVFLKLTLSKKDLILSHIFYIRSKKIKNFSYKGYKITRGLPIYNQRTRTNAKTFKNKKQKVFKRI